MEFSSAYGLKKGTNVNFKGVTIGYVYNISVKPNKVVVLIHVNSSDILIPKNSLIESNQVGLFNDVVIDITLLDNLYSFEYRYVHPSSIQCLRSPFICSNFYVKGYKGLNYDDLVRATTRISQRFDDPRFFSLFYILLQNSIDLSSEIIYLVNYTSYLLFNLANLVILLLIRYLV
uniref:Ycf22 n=1 Tax=Laurencia catarinensis TaxID=197326 RepID=UPI0028D15F97|nr:Ycf22 [Laurencia catarinensis]WMP12425.1 Ycf22 [Laurencia catarinensis]